MEEHIDFVIQYLKDLKHVRGCITGSSLLGYFPKSNQDVDLFVYDETALNKVLTTLDNDPRFLILALGEQKKFDLQINVHRNSFKTKDFIQTIKFVYNTCIPVNIILKPYTKDIFSVLSSFDMDIISIGYDVETKQILDLGNAENRKLHIADYNKWNIKFDKPDLWNAGHLLRQIERVIKYYKRGYNTDLVMEKYIQIIDTIQSQENPFQFSQISIAKDKIAKANTKIIKKICEVWLKTHEITDEQLDLLKTKIKEI